MCCQQSLQERSVMNWIDYIGVTCWGPDKWQPFCRLGFLASRHQSIIWTIFLYFNDDVIKWKHFPCYWPFVWGIYRSPVNSSHKGQWRGALMFSLICFWINAWVNNRKAGDLRRHHAYYDVTVMMRHVYRQCCFPIWITCHRCPITLWITSTPFAIRHQVPRQQTWVNFNPNMDN